MLSKHKVVNLFRPRSRHFPLYGHQAEIRGGVAISESLPQQSNTFLLDLTALSSTTSATQEPQKNIGPMFLRM